MNLTAGALDVLSRLMFSQGHVQAFTSSVVAVPDGEIDQLRKLGLVEIGMVGEDGPPRQLVAIPSERLEEVANLLES